LEESLSLVLSWGRVEVEGAPTASSVTLEREVFASFMRQAVTSRNPTHVGEEA
jgi:hypothetical protein